MTLSEAIEAMTQLDKATRGMNFPHAEVFRMTTCFILHGLRQAQPDESLLKDAGEHLEAAKRLIGGQA
jgi:hypothetical protein